ncbi:MAG TPA: type II secretion system F family protein [bacterium]|nr:type II secretion system F family protein [bacterium]
MNPILIPVLVGAAILTAGIGIWLVGFRRDRLAERLREIGGPRDDAGDMAEEILSGGRLPFWTKPIMLLSLLLPGHADSEVLRWELAGAGYRQRDMPRVFAGFRILMLAALAGAAWWAAQTFGLLRNEALVLTAVAAFLGFMSPWMILRVLQARRREEITLSLPDALDLMVICVEAGQGLNAALASVARESAGHAPATSEELRLVNLEMSAGVARVQALRNFANRTGIEDVRALVAVLVQSDRFGTSVAQALRVHAQSLRTRRRQRAEEAARKTPVKMVFPLVFCVFPALLVVILAPGIIELVRALKGVA